MAPDLVFEEEDTASNIHVLCIYQRPLNLGLLGTQVTTSGHDEIPSLKKNKIRLGTAMEIM